MEIMFEGVMVAERGKILSESLENERTSTKRRWHRTFVHHNDNIPRYGMFTFTVLIGKWMM